MKKLLILAAMSVLFAGSLQAGPFSYAKQNRFYVQSTMGIANVSDMNFTDPGTIGDATYNNKAGFQIQGAFGRYFDHLRLELEYSFRNYELQTNATANADSDLHSMMVNVFYEAPIGDMFFAYMGGGAGASIMKYELGSASDADTLFSFQFLAGAGYRMTDDLSLLLGYRYFRTLDSKFDVGGRTVSVERQAIHGFEAGVRFDF